MSALLGYVFSNFHPATPENREQVVHWLQAMADPNSADHLQAKAWLRAEMARNLVRKIVVSAGAGLRGINIGNFEDWRTRIGGLDFFGVVGTGTSMFMGLMDTSKTRQYAGSALPFTFTSSAASTGPVHRARHSTRCNWSTPKSASYDCRADRFGRACGRIALRRRRGRCGCCGPTMACSIFPARRRRLSTCCCQSMAKRRR